MKIRRVKKSAVTMGLVVVMTLVSFALGLAQDRASVGFVYSFGLQHGVPDRAACLGDYTVRLGLVPKWSDSSIALGSGWNEAVVLCAPRPVPNLRSIFAVAKQRKIPLYLLDSVLLI